LVTYISTEIKSGLSFGTQDITEDLVWKNQASLNARSVRSYTVKRAQVHAWV